MPSHRFWGRSTGKRQVWELSVGIRVQGQLGLRAEGSRRPRTTSGKGKLKSDGHCEANSKKKGDDLPHPSDSSTLSVGGGENKNEEQL